MTVHSNADLGKHVVCPCEPGRGTAAFGDQCPERQRHLMAERRCGICTKVIKPTSQLLFIGAAAAGFYVEPPVHPRCAAYALQVCPALSTAGGDVELAIARTYTLAERRLTGVANDGTPLYAVFPFRAPQARHRGVLDFYLAFPEDAARLPAPRWLADQAPKL